MVSSNTTASSTSGSIVGTTHQPENTNFKIKVDGSEEIRNDHSNSNSPTGIIPSAGTNILLNNLNTTTSATTSGLTSSTSTTTASISKLGSNNTNSKMTASFSAAPTNSITTTTNNNINGNKPNPKILKKAETVRGGIDFPKSASSNEKSKTEKYYFFFNFMFFCSLIVQILSTYTHLAI